MEEECEIRYTLKLLGHKIVKEHFLKLDREDFSSTESYTYVKEYIHKGMPLCSTAMEAMVYLQIKILVGWNGEIEKATDKKSTKYVFT